MCNRRSHRKFQVALRLFLELVLHEACLFVGFFKGSTFSTLKGIFRKSLYKGVQYQKLFWSLVRSPGEIIF